MLQSCVRTTARGAMIGSASPLKAALRGAPNHCERADRRPTPHPNTPNAPAEVPPPQTAAPAVRSPHHAHSSRASHAVTSRTTPPFAIVRAVTSRTTPLFAIVPAVRSPHHATPRNRARRYIAYHAHSSQPRTPSPRAQPSSAQARTSSRFVDDSAEGRKLGVRSRTSKSGFGRLRVRDPLTSRCRPRPPQRALGGTARPQKRTRYSAWSRVRRRREERRHSRASACSCAAPALPRPAVPARGAFLRSRGRRR